MDNEELKKLFDVVLSDKLKLLSKRIWISLWKTGSEKEKC